MTPISIKTNKTLRKTKKGRAFIRNGFDPEADITAILNQDLSSKSKGKVVQNEQLDDNSETNSFVDNLIITNGLSDDSNHQKQQKTTKLRNRKHDVDDSSESSLQNTEQFKNESDESFQSTDKYNFWTPDQDSHLTQLVDKYSTDQTHLIHKCMNDYINSMKKVIPKCEHEERCVNKTEVECMDRWLFLKNHAEDGTIKQIKGNWTPEEDLILKQKVEEYGLKKWKEIATFLPGRIGK